MKLRRLRIDRLPGIDESFEIELSEPGIHIIYGPNAIGKSSICRAVKMLYWDDFGPSERTSVSGQFELEGGYWRVEREGQSLRWRSDDELRVPPRIPASHHHRSFFLRLRDLIDPSRDGTKDIASEINRQMSGGYDLQHVLDGLFPMVSKNKHRNQRKEFNNAQKKIQEAEGSQIGLQRRADELKNLQTQLDEAAESDHRLPLVRRAIELANLIKEQNSVMEKIKALPDALANLNGQELEQISQFKDRIVELEKRIRILQSQIDAARDAKKESRLSAVVDKSILNVLRQNAEELVKIDLELQNAKTNHSECHSELKSAQLALGCGNLDQANFALESHHQLFNFLRNADKHRLQKRAIEERLRLLESIEQSAEGKSQLEDFRTAANLLREWLRAPETESTQDRLKARSIWIFFAAAIAVVGAGMAVLIDPRFGLLLTAAAGVMVPVLLMRSTRPDSRTRTSAEKSYAKLDIGPPEIWIVASVEHRLRNLDEKVISIESRLQRARDRDVERQTLNSQLAEVIEKGQSLDEQRNNLAEKLNLESIPPDAELVDMALSLDQLRKALNKYESAASRVSNLETTHTNLLSELSKILQRHGELAPENAKFAKEYLGNLSDRNVQLAKAINEELQASSQLEQICTDQNQVVELIRQIYEKASLENGDLSGIERLQRFLPEYHDLKEQSTRLEGQITLYRDELAKAGETELADSRMGELEQLKQALSTAATKADKLREEIAEIKVAVSETSHSNNLQELIAQREKTRTELQDLRDKAIFATAGRFLVDLVEHEYEQNQMPRVFERARNHFSEFTLRGYELCLDRDDKSPRLSAKDLRNNENRELNELSDGTRIQLLLAAHFAFAEEIEQGEKLPLFLDEALDQSDPVRFEAIVSSLARIADDQGRQILYLTSDPVDRDRILNAIGEEIDVPVNELDLGWIRNKEHSLTKPDELVVPPKTVIPVPGRESMEEYGIKLGVPAFSPSKGYAHQHFFYVLSDNLSLLHEVLLNGIKWVGLWKTVSETALAEQLISHSNSATEIEFRVRLLEEFCEAWIQGRSRNIDIDVLIQSGAVSKKYLNKFADISRELKNDPKKLISVLQARKDPRLKRFRNKRVEYLEKYLCDNRYIDNSPILDENEITIRVLASSPAISLPKEVARECVRRWWIWATKTSVDNT